MTAADNDSDAVTVVRDVMVPMRDGVHMATDIFFPPGCDRSAPHPVLLHRTPYNKIEAERMTSYAPWFARHGYIGVMQDCRGCYKSEGDVDFFAPEAEDGFDTLEWISQQEWSNGKVGTWGTSWASWTQTGPAALGSKHLAVMVPNMSGAFAHESSVRHGGALELRFLAWAFWHSACNTQRALKSNPAIDAALNHKAPTFTDWLTRMPLRRGQTQLSIVPAYEEWALKIQTEANLTDYWKQPSLSPGYYWDDFPDIPILIVGGWYDSYTRSTFRNFEGLSSRKKGPIKVLVGPWLHGHNTVEQTFAGDIEFGEDSALASFRDLHKRWFDAALKGVDTGIAHEAPVEIFVMGGGGGQRTAAGRLFHGGSWRQEKEWPLARTQYTPFYLQDDGGLIPEKPDDDDSSTTYRFDPSNPVPSLGGNVSALCDLLPSPAGVMDPAFTPRAGRIETLLKPGGYDQVEGPQYWGCTPPYLPLGSRPDVLVFETDPLKQDMEVTGPIEVFLWVSSSAVDTDFTAKLIDVYPPSSWYPFGYALNLTDSIMRLRFRNGYEHGEELLTPGNRVQVQITLYPTSNLFGAGHRIRLDVSSSNFPRFDVNPNTGDAIGTERRRQGADNTVFHSASYPSHIVLPIVPAK